MAAIPADAKRPADHQQSTQERVMVEAKQDELLADLPDSVTPPHELFVAQLNEIMMLQADLEDLIPKNVYEDEPTDHLVLLAKERDLTFELPSPPDGKLTLDRLGEIAREIGVSDEGSKPVLVARIQDANTRAIVIEALIEDDETVDTRDRAQIMAIFKLAAAVDELFRTQIASDRTEYDTWSRGKKHQHFFALLTRYAAAAGN